MRSILLGATMVGLLMQSCTDRQTEIPQKPNFIILQADDLGWDDLSINGNNIIETPHIDALAKDSKRFSNFYVNPVCAPTRASLLTGRHFLKTGVSHVHGGKDFIHLDETVFAETFKNAGYATGMWGKWHSGKSPGYYPWERGFNEAYMAKLYDHETNEGHLNGKHVKHAEWADEVIVNYAIDFIERNRNKPFLAYLSFLTCHSPLKAPEQFVEKYKQKGLSENFATLYGMIEHMDIHIHRLLDYIDKQNLTNKTVVMFMSDNGPAVINNLLTDDERKTRYVNDYKGHKGNIWENGVKSPLFIRWPGKIKPDTTHQLADITDIYATMLDIANIKIHDNHLPLDGVNLTPVLLENNNITRKKHVYNYAHSAWQPTDKPWSPEGTLNEYQPVGVSEIPALKPGNQVISVRNSRYKLLNRPKKYHDTPYPTGSFVLIDMINDPKEENNIYLEKPEIANRLQANLFNWFETIKQSPHAFHAPVFQIGGMNLNEYPVLAYAPQKLDSSISNAFNFIKNWDIPGASATYKLNVKSPGTYLIKLHYSTGSVPKAPINLYFQNQTLSHKLTDNAVATVGSVKLNEGYQHFSISFTAEETKMNGTLEKFFEISFIPDSVRMNGPGN